MLWYIVLLLVLAVKGETRAPVPDLNKKCHKFVTEGYCEVNPAYMKKNCATSYDAWLSQKRVTNFYSIVETDIFGEEVSFEKLRGKYVFLINVASEDGTSAENYMLLQKLSTLRSDVFEIMIFPCDQFGHKEPRSNVDIAVFARRKGFRGVVMSKGDVNGVSTRSAFQFLKGNSNKTHINGNFDGKYLLHREGDVIAFHPDTDVFDFIHSLVATEKRSDL